jgi:hypothetical protein
MAESVAARSIVTTLAGNALQFAAFLRRCCSNALDVATLLRWPATRWTLRCVAAMSGSALGLGALLRCLTALQLRPTLRCSVFVFVFFLFYPTT